MLVSTLYPHLDRGNGLDQAIVSLVDCMNKLKNGLEMALIHGGENGFSEDGFLEDTLQITGKFKPVLGFKSSACFYLVDMIPDESIIHIHHPFNFWPIIGKDAIKVATWHGNGDPNWMDPEFGSLFKRVLRKIGMDLSTNMLKSLDKVVAISDYARNELVENYGFKHEDVERIYNGCDTNRLVGNGVDNKYMLFVGRHVHYKNIRTLIDLAKETGYKLICVGDGLDKSNLEIYAKKVEACVEFKGNVPFDEMVKLYQECSFYVTASKWEGFGLPVIEAGACEKPALVPNNTAHPELIEDGKTGFIYDDYGELARFAKRLIQDQELRRSMGLQGRKRVESKFSLDRTARKYIELYKELVLN